ncbi:MAG: glycosyltransferase family 2 protein [Planctomycetaceae bacterium]
MLRYLTALPVFNEQSHIAGVLNEVRRYSQDILVVNDGSTDGTAAELARFPDVHVATHARNLGYGAALRSAFLYTTEHGYDALVTIDCDGQHEPRLIPELVRALTSDVDIVSGSRYLTVHAGDSVPPPDRRQINHVITERINHELRLHLTDGFCGFKAYRASALAALHVTELGYAMPLQLWVQAVAAGLRIVEFPVPLVYLEENRSFGGSLDDAGIRLAHYHAVFDRELARSRSLPPARADQPTACQTR